MECYIDPDGVNFVVPSNSKLNTVYDVNMDREGRTKCTCPDYYNRAKEGEPGSYQCIHILASFIALGVLLNKKGGMESLLPRFQSDKLEKNPYFIKKMKEDKQEVEDLLLAVKSQEFANEGNKKKLIRYLNKQSLRIHHKSIFYNNR